jgi:hypothetical protein
VSGSKVTIPTSSPKSDLDLHKDGSPSAKPTSKFYFIVPDTLFWAPADEAWKDIPPARLEVLNDDPYEARLITYGPLVDEQQARHLGVITVIADPDAC